MRSHFFDIINYLRGHLQRRVVRVAEGARLESVYIPKGYREFESLTLRLIINHSMVLNV